MEQLLNKTEIEQLETKSLLDPRNAEFFNGLLYDINGSVYGKSSNFKYQDDIDYPKYYFGEVKNEYENVGSNLALMSWHTLKSKNFGDATWRIQGLVPEYGLTILAGVSGEKKTWLALHMAYCIATGSHFLSSDKFATKKGKVLYIDAEMGPRELQRRGKLLDFDNIPNEEFVIVTGEDASLGTEEDFDELEDTVINNNISIVIIDTLRGVANGLNEDKAEDVRRFLQRFNSLKNKGITIIILDHCRKPIRNEGYAPKKEQLLGSQDKVASAESVIMLKSEQNSPAFAVYHVKNRTGVELKPFMAIMKDSEDRKKVTFTFDGEFNEETSKMDTAKVVIPQIIGSASMTTKQLVDVMRRDQKVGERYTREALKQLVINEKLTIEKIGKENSYKISAIGLLLK